MKNFCKYKYRSDNGCFSILSTVKYPCWNLWLRKDSKWFLCLIVVCEGMKKFKILLLSLLPAAGLCAQNPL